MTIGQSLIILQRLRSGWVTLPQPEEMGESGTGCSVFLQSLSDPGSVDEGQ